MLGRWNGPTCKGRDIKHGCRITLLNQYIKEDYCLFLSYKKSKL